MAVSTGNMALNNFIDAKVGFLLLASNVLNKKLRLLLFVAYLDIDSFTSLNRLQAGSCL